MITFKDCQERGKRCLVVIGLAALLLMPVNAPSAGDGSGGPPIPYDSSGQLDGDTVVSDTLPPSFS